MHVRVTQEAVLARKTSKVVDLIVDADSFVSRLFMALFAAAYTVAVVFTYIAAVMLLNDNQAGPAIALIVLSVLGNITTAVVTWRYYSSSSSHRSATGAYSVETKTILQFLHIWFFFELQRSWRNKAWSTCLQLIALAQTVVVLIPAAVIVNYVMLREPATPQAVLVLTEVCALFSALVAVALYRQKVSIAISGNARVVCTSCWLLLHLICDCCCCRSAVLRMRTMRQQLRSTHTRGATRCSEPQRLCRA
jgi:uncharacterized membrane protein